MPKILSLILDTHPDVISRYDTALNFTYGNEATADFFSTTRKDLIGSNLLDRLQPETHANILAQLELITAETPSHSAVQALQVGEQKQYILWTNIGIFDGDTLVGYQSVGRDVTADMELERQLKAQSRALDSVQTELRAVLDAVPSRIWYKDDQNNILRLNQAAAESMGMTVEEVEGRNTYDLFGDAAKSYHEADLKVFESGEPLRGIVEPFTPDTGEQGWSQTDKIPFGDDTDEPRILVVSTDITELKEQEAILKSINKNLDDFASMTSHDLQAPLRKIAISAELMELELADQLPDSAGAYFTDISQGVTRMRTLIQSFLKFMRASPAGVELDTIDLSELLRRTADETAKGSLSEVGGTLILPDHPIHVRGDQAMLRQVFANLLQNAIKYRSEDRPITIDISAEQDQQFWAISVCDNGSGVNEREAEHIFDLFGRSKPHTEVEGSGVGLALCRRIITLHGGTIELVQKNTPGSCFQVKLNRARMRDG